jgi:hypothetical protein
MSTNSSSATNRISTFLTMIVFVVIALSFLALGLAIYMFPSRPDFAAYLVAIGFIAMALSAYILLQSRRRATAMKIETPQTMTTIECKKCGFKNVREFKRGDYVFKELDKCEKCPDERQMITAIYKEVKEKEKTFPF